MPVKPDFSDFQLSDQDVQTLVLQIIGKTAIERNFALQPSDPLMALPTMLKILLEDLVNRHAQMLTKLCEFYSDNAIEFRAVTQRDLQEIVVGGTKDFEARIRQTMSEAAANARAEIRDEVLTCLQNARQDQSALKKLIHFLILAGILAAGGGVAALAAAGKLAQLM